VSRVPVFLMLVCGGPAAFVLLAQQGAPVQNVSGAEPVSTSATSSSKASSTPSPSEAAEVLPGRGIEEQQLRQLLNLRRVYVDQLAGGDTAKQIRDMIIGALERSRLFVVTEDESKADAYLRGSADDSVFTETRSSREGINARVGGRAGNSQSRYNGTSVSATLGVGDSDDFYEKERKHEARASVRLVSRDGDVLWSSTQESQGAKYKGSAADVADKIGRELADAYTKAKKLSGSPQAAASVPGSPKGTSAK